MERGFLVFKLIAVLALLIQPQVDAFNLKVASDKQQVYRSRKTKSAFGFSIAFHQHSLEGYSLVVGAPQENASSIQSNLPTGAAYACDVPRFKCRQLPFRKGAVSVDITKFKNSRLSATIVSQSGSTLICAPRATDDLNGHCYVGYGPLKELTNIEFDFGNSTKYCQRGISAAFSKDTSYVFVGAPSCESDNGRIYNNYMSGLTTNAFQSSEGLYFSHAIATGTKRSKTAALASSIITNNNGSIAGKVVVLDLVTHILMQNLPALDGYQPGELFGAALVYIDVDGDGIDELIVGAPLHSEYSDVQLRHDIGVVYVFQERTSGGYSMIAKLSGSGKNGARFGASLVDVGDIDGDGYNDVAVGAPYDAKGAGCVYIFQGSIGGLHAHASQIICGDQFEPALRGFGFSLAGGVDVDFNDYSDVAVGAHLSDAVVFLPARPVIRLEGLVLAFQSETLTLDKHCNITVNGRTSSVTCTQLTFCVGHGGAKAPALVTLAVTLELDDKQHKDASMLFSDTNHKRHLTELQLRANERPICRTLQTYIRPDVPNKHLTVQAAMTIQVKSGGPPLTPVLDAYGVRTVNASVNFYPSCGSDKICVPDLKLMTTIEGGDTAKIIQGSTQSVMLDVEVVNDGEDAFQAAFFMKLPEPVEFVRYESNNGQIVICSPSGFGRVLLCDLGLQFPTNGVLRFKVLLETRPDVTDGLISVPIECEVNSTNAENPQTLSDNRQQTTLVWGIDASLDVVALCRPEILSFDFVSMADTDTQPQFVQFYEVRSAGPSEILGVDVTIWFATRTNEGVALCWLSEPPEVQRGRAVCHTDETSDPHFAIIRCRSEELSITQTQPLIIRLSARLSTDIIDVFDILDDVKITSKMMVVVTHLPFDIDAALVAPASTTTTLLVHKLKKIEALLNARVQWWVYAVSSGCALVVLALITMSLYKCGFFIRKRLPHDGIKQDTVYEDAAEPIDYQSSTLEIKI